MPYLSLTQYGVSTEVELQNRDGGPDRIHLVIKDRGADSRSSVYLSLTCEEAEQLGEKLIAAAVKIMERA